jgi:hypothetical protein
MDVKDLKKGALYDINCGVVATFVEYNEAKDAYIFNSTDPGPYWADDTGNIGIAGPWEGIICEPYIDAKNQ